MGSIKIQAALDEVEQLLRDEKNISPALAAAIKVLIAVIPLLMARLGLNSHNSSKPPSQDPYRARKTDGGSGKARGGQPGRAGTTLHPVDDPDAIEIIHIDKRSLPRSAYQVAGFERRQVIDIRIERYVTEYRAEILVNVQGKRFVAPFPQGVTRPVQYGASVKAQAVYLSMFQLIPYARIETHFAELYALPISAGSLVNFNQEACERLDTFVALAKLQLPRLQVMHADETGVNVEGKLRWLHTASSEYWTLFSVHEKRGREAMDEIGVLPAFTGTLVHDHWKPYYLYPCVHALCNAHHLRELTYAHEAEGQAWALKMKTLLLKVNAAVEAAGGCLDAPVASVWRRRYRRLLKKAEEECPPPDKPPSGKRGRLKRSKSRNLLERLRDYEADVLRFMDNSAVPFTNNQGERDIRMTKVQQKISGCFRSPEGAETFCRIRSYLSTCRKHNVGVGEALERLFRGVWPDFIQELLKDSGECGE